ncbi:MAG: hypothetical protein WCK58_05730 [Chloroflexota bacterium]
MAMSVGPLEFLVVAAILGLLAIPVAGVVAIVVMLARRGQPPAPPPDPKDDPRVILPGRLARGEITRDDYECAMRALGYTGRSR